jgi:hypothetical protein
MHDPAPLARQRLPGNANGMQPPAKSIVFHDARRQNQAAAVLSVNAARWRSAGLWRLEAKRLACCCIKGACDRQAMGLLVALQGFRGPWADNPIDWARVKPSLSQLLLCPPNLPAFSSDATGVKRRLDVSSAYLREDIRR